MYFCPMKHTYYPQGMTKTNSKALLLGLVLGLMLPISVIAQQGGGVFGYGKKKEQADSYGFMGRGSSSGRYNVGTQHFGEDVNGGYNIGTQQFGQELPLGSGWLVLTLAGAAYAFKKRKNNHKK